MPRASRFTSTARAQFPPISRSIRTSPNRLVSRGPSFTTPTGGKSRTEHKSVPAIEFLEACPGKITRSSVGCSTRSHSAAASALRRREVGGDARHDDGLARDPPNWPGRVQFRLFYRLENADDEELLKRGLGKPAIVVITRC